MWWCYNTLLSNFHFVVAYRRLKTKENFKLLALQVVMITYERWSFTRGSKYSLFDFETFDILKTGRWIAKGHAHGVGVQS